MNIQAILDEAFGKDIKHIDDNHFLFEESYNYGKIDELISGMDKKIDEIKQDLNSLNILLENCNAK